MALARHQGAKPFQPEQRHPPKKQRVPEAVELVEQQFSRLTGPAPSAVDCKATRASTADTGRPGTVRTDGPCPRSSLAKPAEDGAAERGFPRDANVREGLEDSIFMVKSDRSNGARRAGMPGEFRSDAAPRATGPLGRFVPDPAALAQKLRHGTGRPRRFV